MAFPASQIVNVTPRLAGAGMGTSNFGATLLLANESAMRNDAEEWPVNSHKEIISADDLLPYFEETAEAYLAAQMFFSVMPKPLTLKVWLRDDAPQEGDPDTPTEALAKAADATWFFWFDVTKDMRATTADLLTLQAWAGASSKFFAATTNDPDVLDSQVENDPVSEAKQAGVRYCFIEYHTDNAYAGLQTAALFARVNYSADNSTITAFGKRKPGLQALDLRTSEYMQLIEKGAVFYTQVEAGEAVDNGRVLNPYTTSAFGETIADVVDTEACVNAMIVSKYNYLMNATTKRPQTPAGQAGAIDAVAQVCEQFYRNGFLGPREYVDTETGETQIAEHGYVILTRPEDVYLLSDADRGQHKLYPITARLFRAGAAFEISTTIDIE